MSKELTEQWRNGTLTDFGGVNFFKYYYVKNETGREVIKTSRCLIEDNTPDWEILAPVPSYDKHNELVQEKHRLEKQLSSISEQLKEAHEVIKECQRLIKRDGVLTSTEGAIKEKLKGYLDKWGVE